MAKAAGVSVTLVSRTVNNQSGVSPKSRAKIQAAIEQLHYESNALARSLVLKSTKTVGVVMDSLCEPYFFSMIEGLEEGADRIEYDILFSSGRNSAEHKKRYVKYFMQGRTDGMVLYGSRLEDEGIIQMLAKSKFPFVVVENTFPTLDINNVSLDNAFGSALAVDFLIRRGCRKICHVGGDMQHRVSMDRQTGFITAMQRHGLTVTNRMIIQADFEIKSSYEVMKAFLASVAPEDRPDGFYCGSDRTAYGTVMALEECGCSVPEKAMVIGFDDETPPFGYRHRLLTTISQPLKQMGLSAMELLQKSMENPDAPHQQVEFYPELVERETTR